MGAGSDVVGALLSPPSAGSSSGSRNHVAAPAPRTTAVSTAIRTARPRRRAGSGGGLHGGGAGGGVAGPWKGGGVTGVRTGGGVGGPIRSTTGVDVLARRSPVLGGGTDGRGSAGGAWANRLVEGALRWVGGTGGRVAAGTAVGMCSTVATRSSRSGGRRAASRSATTRCVRPLVQEISRVTRRWPGGVAAASCSGRSKNRVRRSRSTRCADACSVIPSVRIGPTSRPGAGPVARPGQEDAVRRAWRLREVLHRGCGGDARAPGRSGTGRPGPWPWPARSRRPGRAPATAPARWAAAGAG